MARRSLLPLLCWLVGGCGALPHPHAALAGGQLSIAPPQLTAPQHHSAERQQHAIDRLLARTPYLSRGGSKRYVALTFDDGPARDTQRLLKILRVLHAHATFFQVGAAVGQLPKLARRELIERYPLGDHTQTHPFLKSLTTDRQRREILGEADRIRKLGAPYPRLFRPPYGSFDRRTLAIARAAGMLTVLWSVDTRDFSRPGSAAIVHTVVSETRPGAIILMHDGGGPRGQTLAAVPRIVRALRRRHYKLVTVPQLVLRDPPNGHQRKPHELSGR